MFLSSIAGVRILTQVSTGTDSVLAVVPFMIIFVLVHEEQAPIWSAMNSRNPVAQNPAT